MLSWDYDLKDNKKLLVEKWCKYGFYIGEKIDINLLKKYIDEINLHENDKEFFKFLIKKHDLQKQSK